MNRYSQFTGIFACVFTLLFLSAGLSAGSMGTSSGHDLDQLWAKAKDQFDLKLQDALLLHESRDLAILENGDLTARIHCVVWIGTEMGIESYADLRVPYNLSVSKMKVIKLRTWRDGRWWPDQSEISPTAVVETVPHELALADDYSSMRETMLLHDGIELPCILETEYEITIEGGAKDGYDEVFVFARPDPAVEVEYSLSVPAGTEVHYISGNGIGEPETAGEEGGTDRYIWRAEGLKRLGTPEINDPASYAPYLSWSTWKGWEQLASKIISSFEAAADPGQALADTARARTIDEQSVLAKARKAASLVNEFTRNIHYSPEFWSFSPRLAERTYETAYGHALDRAVLAAALFRSIGVEARPVYRSLGPGSMESSVPGLSRFGDMLLLAGDESAPFLYDPGTGELTDGVRMLYGYTVFEPGKNNNIPFRYQGAQTGETGRLELVMTIDAGGDERVTGKGFINAENILSPYSEMSGLDGQALSYMDRLAGSVLGGADAGSYNLESFSRPAVRGGFSFEAEKPEPDGLGRISIVAGDPAGGIIDAVPDDILLYSSVRNCPVLFPSEMVQKVSFIINTGKREIVYLPEEVAIENTVGSFHLGVKNENGRVSVDRELSIGMLAVSAEMWPQLRALLLAETDMANRTVILK
ncbi:MAG: DUF3857 domain-containing protein [Candidatus Krumholzibacteriota bacterium]|nr:DUF3857 domain-containing protein [Candidatus Krumholzibacteriota bacterium]